MNFKTVGFKRSYCKTTGRFPISRHYLCSTKKIQSHCLECFDQNEMDPYPFLLQILVLEQGQIM